ncbi:nitronate monooxygenase [Domibacillus aminovorans]|uniref:Probable nitronate monooxygenase n=1 Tax=Domibacillus aminovorans TaxID=29332 RepID=A0A177KQU7_9BACI|nr:nitronate monooxygenase [Domibacillus aminovorans]OAH55732.1 nitronate monooxygenase [Domibacillus aminovorans]
MLNNEITETLHIEYPIIQAPMAGGVTTSELVAAVSNYGGLGTIGAGYMSPTQMRKQIKEVRQLTSNYFGINVFVPNEFNASESEIKSANHLLQPIREQLNVHEKDQFERPKSKRMFEIFNEQIKVVMEENVPICSFTFGVPSKEVIAALKQQNIILMGTATTVREAVEIEKIGMDIVVVQGSEAGGHRGHFMNSFQESLIGLMSLIPQVVDSVSIPVVAAGGIMDGRGLMASICLGAKGVQMGTAFLTCIESGAHHVHKEAILHSKEDETALTRVFSGKWARGIKNKFIVEMQEHETSFPDFPIQNTLTQAIRKASTSQNNHDFMSLWSGQSTRLAKNQTVEMLMKNMMAEATKIKKDI